MNLEQHTTLRLTPADHDAMRRLRAERPELRHLSAALVLRAALHTLAAGGTETVVPPRKKPGRKERTNG